MALRNSLFGVPCSIFSMDDGGNSLVMIADVPHVSYWGVRFMTYVSGYLYAIGIGVHKIFRISLEGEMIEFVFITHGSGINMV